MPEIILNALQMLIYWIIIIKPISKVEVEAQIMW